MSTPSTLFCTMLETEYNNLIALIEIAITTPTFALTQLKSNLNRILNILYGAIETGIAVLREQLIAILRLDLIDQFSSNLSFCNVAWVCAPLKEVLFKRSTLSFLSDSQYEDVQTSYEDFEKYVCKSGFLDLIDSWTAESLDIIKEKIEELRSKLLGSIGIDEIIDKYQQVLEESGLFDLLDQLELYSDCAFEACNYLTTQTNYLDDLEEKLQLKKVGSSWIVNITDSFQEVYDKDVSLNLQLDTLEQQIYDFLDNGKRDERGISPDQVMG